MAIANLQRNLVELGRIRLGRRTSGGRPSRLDTFRFTSGAEHLIEEIAALYGGDVEVWDGGRGKQWQVITPTSLIPVYIPPQRIEPWMEAWANGVCTRRCDTERDVIKDEPCSCNPEKRLCKPTTRVNVLLADVPGLGVWRVESHGWWAAGEMAQLSELINGIKIPLPARLLLEKRGGKRFNRETKQVETLDYNVPVLLLDSVTSRHIQLGEDAVSQAIQAGGHSAAAVGAPAQAPALEAGPAGPSEREIAEGLEAIARAFTSERMKAIAETIQRLGSPEVLVTAYKTRWTTLRNERAAAQAQTAPPAPPAPPAPTETSAGAAPPTEPPAPPAGPVAATPEVPDDPAARKAALQALLGEAGALKINTPTLENYLRDGFDGATIQTATTAQFEQLARMLRGQQA